MEERKKKYSDDGCLITPELPAGEIVTTIGINDGTNKFTSVNLSLCFPSVWRIINIALAGNCERDGGKNGLHVICIVFVFAQSFFFLFLRRFVYC